jgi:outer membrane protein assembly factor BamB
MTSSHLWKIFATIVILGLTSFARGQEWPRFRGPNGQGISYAKTIPIKWSESDYNWKITLPGGGHSSPVVWDNKVFITSAQPQTAEAFLLVIDVNDGTILWQKQFELTRQKLNRDNSYATGTPVVDANNVYVLWPTDRQTTLVAFSHNGDPIWKRTFPAVMAQHGPSISPIIYNDLIVFTLEQEDLSGVESPQSCWIAVDRRTGENRWQILRKNNKVSYSTPCIYRSDERSADELIFTSREHGITGINPQTGDVKWELKSAFQVGQRVVSSPVIAEGLLIGTCGEGGAGRRLVAIQVDAVNTGDGSKEVYELKGPSAPYVPTSLAKDGLLFTFHDQGDVCCLRSKTGELLWHKKPAGKFYGSPVWVNGILYCIDRNGDVVVIKAAPQFELLAINHLGETSHATPAVAAGRMFLRTYSHLLSVGR